MAIGGQERCTRVASSEFVTIAGQLVRESAVTRLSHGNTAGTPLTGYFVHFVDGGSVNVSETEYHALKKRFAPPASSASRKRSKGA
jgi:hypothetical protein